MAKDDKKVLLIAQEIKLAKILAGNNKKLRERTLKRLGKWLIDRANTAPVSDDVFMRIWKGLFYSMWMSDKPLVQEECAENIAKLVHFNDTKTSLMFFKSFLQTMVNEWFGIDHYRIDKFLMLVRRVFRQAFEVLKNAEWSDEHINNFREILNQTALKIDSTTALGLILHVDEIYLEELAKVSRGKINAEKVLELIQPFAQQLARMDDIRHLKHVNQHIFKYLMDQSDVGIEYKEKFHIWRRQGFPGGTMDTLEKVEVENGADAEDLSDEEDDGPKDPRAGKVDVVLPQLQFDPVAIVKFLSDLRFKSYTTSLGRKQISILIQQFKELSEGKYPLGATKVATLEDDGYSTDLKTSVKRLEKLENKLSKQSKRAKKREMKEKKVKEILREQVEQLVKENKLKINKSKNKKDESETIPKNQTNNKKKPVKHIQKDLQNSVVKCEAQLIGNTTNNPNKSKNKNNKGESETIPKNQTNNKKKPHFDEESEEFQNFVAKSEAKLMEKFRKNKRKSPGDADVVPNPIKTKKNKQNVLTKEDLLNTSEADLAKIPTKNPNTFVRNSGMWVVEEFDVPESAPTSPNTKSPKKDEWSKPLQNGETEYFVVSSKMKKKLKRLSDNKTGPLKRFSNDDVLCSSSPKSKTPKKSSVIVKNPFSTPETPKHKKTPKSEKKIKFSDKNHAQDFSDHLKQIMSSPGIPYDSKKKPIKPLLKPSPVSSPINPFYRKLK